MNNMIKKDIAISVENLSKLYRVGIKDKMHETIAATIADFARNPLKNYKKYRSLYRFDDVLDKNGNPIINEREDILWALKNVSFEVARGEILGIIGGNGAGKSTLLKVLSRVTHPTSGNIHINGRVGSLLEVGTGFHPELTGRENIFLNATILGMRKKEVEKKLDQIIDFAGVDKFLDTPVKRYSSGMRVRLAFSVAAHLEPEILIIDEVLAVGDAAFQQKCLDKMQDVGKGGRTVIFVSHNMPAVSALCTKGLVINNGQIAFEGATADAVDLYLSPSQDVSSDIAEREDRSGRGSIRMEDIWFENDKGKRLTDVRIDEAVSIKGTYRGAPLRSSLRFVFAINDYYEQRLLRFDTTVTGTHHRQWPQDGVAVCKLDAPLCLKPGSYKVSFAIYNNDELEDYMASALSFHVIEGDFYGSGKLPDAWPIFLLKHSWSVE